MVGAGFSSRSTLPTQIAPQTRPGHTPDHIVGPALRRRQSEYLASYVPNQARRSERLDARDTT